MIKKWGEMKHLVWTRTFSNLNVMICLSFQQFYCLLPSLMETLNTYMAGKQRDCRSTTVAILQVRVAWRRGRGSPFQIFGLRSWVMPNSNKSVNSGGGNRCLMMDRRKHKRAGSRGMDRLIAV